MTRKGDLSMPDIDLLKSKEAAAFLRMNTYILYKLAKEGRFPGARIGTRWRFHRADLEIYARTKASQPFSKQKG
jgi:excisionase family DNA binding protein